MQAQLPLVKVSIILVQAPVPAQTSVQAPDFTLNSGSNFDSAHGSNNDLWLHLRLNGNQTQTQTRQAYSCGASHPASTTAQQLPSAPDEVHRAAKTGDSWSLACERAAVSRARGAPAGPYGNVTPRGDRRTADGGAAPDTRAPRHRATASQPSRNPDIQDVVRHRLRLSPALQGQHRAPERWGRTLTSVVFFIKLFTPSL